MQVRLTAASPWITWLVVALNVASFAAALAQGADVMRPQPRLMIELGSNFGPLTISGEWWRLATAPFLHWGILHLALNLWALWTAGPIAERLLGHLGFAALYVFAGLAGSLASVLWNPVVNSAGASGAVFGVYGALLALVVRRHAALPPHAVAALRASALAFVAFNLVNGFVMPGIDNAAHLGGLAGGFLFGLPLVRTTSDPSSRQGGWRLPLALAAGAALLVAASLPIAWPGSPLQAEASYRADAWWFASRERAVLDRFGDAVERVGRRQASRTVIADALREAAPFWQEADRRFSRHPPLRDPALDAERRRLREYIALRRNAFALLLRSLETGSESDLVRGREMNARAEALIRAGRT
jgi:rhomboid protease GluP